MDPAYSPEIPAALSIGIIIMIALLVLTAVVVGIIIWCKIFSKTGYSWALGLLMLVPFGNMIMMLILAFGDWPICKEIRALKTQPVTTAE